MGWFLRSGKGKTRRKSARVATRQAWDPARTWAAVKVLSAIGVVTAISVGWFYTHRQLNRYVAANQARVVVAKRVVFEQPPGWINTALQYELKELVAVQMSPDPLDRTSLVRAADALRASPWVAKVRRLRRDGAGVIHVDATFRRPIALVRHAHGYQLVDEHSILLPGLYMSHQARQMKLPIIVGVHATPSRVGQVWQGDDLAAGLALGAVLNGESFFTQVRAIDVAARDAFGRVRLAIRTDKGMVRWGFAPGRELALEPDVATKLRRLRLVHAKQQRIDAGGHVVDIYGPRVAIHPAVDATQGMQVDYANGR